MPLGVSGLHCLCCRAAPYPPLLSSFDLSLSLLTSYIIYLPCPALPLQFCSFFDVEPRYIEVREGQLVLDPSKLREVVDANTIGEL